MEAKKEIKYTIDAKDRSLGRVAAEAAVLLTGKNSTSFSKEKVSGHQVEIVNASKLQMKEKNLIAKEYKSFSGYPGGLRKETMAHFIKRRGVGEAIRKAIYGMLPKNKLRSVIMKNLTVKE
jgi:large subunit ribosomal protein L13